MLTEIDRHPSTDGNFFGLVNDKDETIQFVRFDEDSWLIDVPVLEGDVCTHALEDDNLTTEKVKEIVKRFFSGGDWKFMCSFERIDAPP